MCAFFCFSIYTLILFFTRSIEAFFLSLRIANFFNEGFLDVNVHFLIIMRSEK